MKSSENNAQTSCTYFIEHGRVLIQAEHCSTESMKISIADPNTFNVVTTGLTNSSITPSDEQPAIDNKTTI